MKLQFTATPEGNCLADIEGAVIARCAVPEGASDDYGYLTMKRAILGALAARNVPSDNLVFWYDGQEQFLNADAAASCNVSLDIDWEALDEALNKAYWFALMTGPDDQDWGTGTHDKEEAIARLREMRADYPDAYIAVIMEGRDPVCVDEIRDI